MTTCSRRGCTKNLRKDNAKGVCSSSCLSPDAPPGMQAQGVSPGELAQRAAVAVEVQATEQGAAARFRAVHDAMGMDPEKTLEEFYSSWLEGIRQALES